MAMYKFRNNNAKVNFFQFHQYAEDGIKLQHCESHLECPEHGLISRDFVKFRVISIRGVKGVEPLCKLCDRKLKFTVLEDCLFEV